MSRYCNGCDRYLQYSSFGVNNSRTDKLEPNCKSCINRKQREKRFRTKDKATKKYEKTLKGVLMRTYRNMLSRVTGVQKKKAHLYLNLEILPKTEFYEWSLKNSDYLFLYENWVKLDYQQKFSPSIDRIDSSKGYLLFNMRWITHSENSSEGSKSKLRQLKEKK